MRIEREERPMATALRGNQVRKQRGRVSRKRTLQAKSVIDLVRVTVGKVLLDPAESFVERLPVNGSGERPKRVRFAVWGKRRQSMHATLLEQPEPDERQILRRPFRPYSQAECLRCLIRHKAYGVPLTLPADRVHFRENCGDVGWMP